MRKGQRKGPKKSSVEAVGRPGEQVMQFQEREGEGEEERL